MRSWREMEGSISPRLSSGESSRLPSSRLPSSRLSSSRLPSSRCRSVQSTPGGKLLTKRRRDRPRTCHGNRSQSECRQLFSRKKGTHWRNSAPVAVVTTPGYSLSRSPVSVHMNINTALFFDDGENEEQRSPSPPQYETRHRLSLRYNSQNLQDDGMDPLEIIVELEELKCAYADLKTETEENKLRMEKDHQDELKKFREEFNEEQNKLITQREEGISECKRVHAKILSDVQDTHDKKLQGTEAEFIATFKIDVDVSEELLADTKKELEKESTEKIVDREKELTVHHRLEMARREFVLKQKHSVEVDELRETLMTEHKIEMYELKKEHKEEAEELISRLTQMHKLEEEVSKNNNHIKELENQVSKLKDEVKSDKTKHFNTEAKLLEAKTALKKSEKNFQQKVKSIELQFKDKVDSLIQENSQLKKKLLLRANEFSHYKSAIESSNARTLHSYKEKVSVMVRARTKAQLSIAMGLSESELAGYPDSKPRPHSAPTTHMESGHARKYVSASDPSSEPGAPMQVGSSQGYRPSSLSSRADVTRKKH